ncbi:Transcriptional regulatory protein DegU [Pirellulimonas nuda]|uniref:Transcriptional regulatory protein DegU n=1 Tax=Pirellulimonas nuda TaxID=2528009 RepID=A0A518DA53_9BACT|nr:response regulator transcription factor [Pirellulimonas nuda]QDU88359.1 Transcriptional regulatory protein DegU [Pirellulimonas nuda]
MAVTLLLVDGHPVVRAGVRALLAGVGIDIVGETDDPDVAVELARSLRPEVVLLEARLPRGSGLDAIGRIKRARSDSAVLMFSGSANPTYAARAHAFGAAGMVSKEASAQELEAAIRKVASGAASWSAEDRRRLSGGLEDRRVQELLETPLTKRENEVLQQLALGLSNREIALALGISYETVKEHVQHLLRKIGVSDRTQAAVWAVRNGLV